MFGQQSGSSPFGAPASTPFGAPAPAQQGFGAPAPAQQGFGAPSQFGAPAPSAFGSAPSGGGFGQPAASRGFGAPAAAFGSPTPAPSGFGAPATPFGAPAPAPSGGLFGSSAPAPSGGLFGAPAPSGFGAPAPASGGLFGASAPAPAPTGFGGFGAPAPAPSAFGAQASAPAFGAPAPSGGLFGSPAPAPSGGMFGAPAPAPSGGMFGAPAPSGMGGGQQQAAVGQGSLAYPFQATRKVDGTSSINFQSITAMGQYEHKSFEELRVEDYMAGNKGSQGQAQQQQGAGGFGSSLSSGFGAPAPAAGGYGAPAPAAGGFGFGAAPAPSGGLFGSPAPAPAPGGFGFGAAPAPAPVGGGMFGGGAPAPAGGGMFGGGASAGGGLFGSAPAPAGGGGLFGSAPAPSAGGGLFGSAPAPAGGGGLFGSPAPAPAGGMFGAPAPAPAGGMFGSPTPAPGGGLFGSTPAPAAGGGMFGSNPAPTAGGGIFGSTPAPAAGGMFGSPAPAPGGGLFGSTPAPAPGGGLFGSTPAPAPSMGGFFGSAPAPAASGGFFGSAPAPAPAMGGMFGSAPAPTPQMGMYGNTQQAPAPAPMGYGGSTILIPPASETLLAQQMAAIENQNKELAVLEAWRGGNGKSPKTSGSHGSIIPTSVFQRDAQSVRYRGLAGSVSTSSSSNGSTPMLSSYQAAPRSAAKIRPRGFGPTKTTIGSASRSTKGMLSPTSFLGSATKQLVIKPDALTPKPKTRLLLSDESMSEKKQTNEHTNGLGNGNGNGNGMNGNTNTPMDLIKGRNLSSDQAETPGSKTDRGLPFENSRIASDKPGFVSPDASAQQRKTPASKVTPPPDSARKRQGMGSPVDQSYDFYRSVVGSPVAGRNGISVEEDDNAINHLIPNLTKDGYVMTPSAETLSNMSEADLAAVPNFIVERIGYGSVAWDGAVDVRGIDLDSVVCIEAKAVEVYHKEEEIGSKPVIGTKLNRSAILTLHDVYPKNGPDSSDIEKEKFERRIGKKTKEMGASLVLYDADIGVWKLRVDHFSRYALDDDSDEDEDEVEIIDTLPAQAEMKDMDFRSGVRAGRTQVSWATVGGLTRFRVPDNEDDDIGEDSNALLALNDSGGNAMQAAEAAYAELSEIDDEMFVDRTELEEQKSLFPDEGETHSDYIENDAFAPPIGPISKINICAQIAKKCNVDRPTSSATDFGMRMGRSFGVCWRPDGSFLHPAVDDKPYAGNKRLMQSRPAVDATSLSSKETLLSVHKKHRININESSEYPIFKLGHKDASMEDYEKAANQNLERGNGSLCSLISHAFKLVSILFGDVKDADPFIGSKRRDHAFELWLRNVCGDDVETEIKEEIANQNYYNAIFAALSGGDFAKAASLARSNGHHMLSLLISNSSFMHGASLSDQMKQWNDSGAIKHFPPELVRIYSLLTNDLQLENELFLNGSHLKWERRFMMLLKALCSDYGGSTSIVPSLVEQYELDVTNGVAPPAHLHTMEYADGQSLGDRSSILFQIMKAFRCFESDRDKMSILSIVSPLGHTSNPVDVSSSFHFAAVLSSLNVCQELTPDQENALIGSFSSQLENAGSWEWAVYVSLCQFGDSRIMWDKKKSLAQDIICRHYVSIGDDNDSQNRRAFLENELGVPSSWFEYSLTISAIQSLDVQSFITHSISISRKDSLKVYEEAILPDVLFGGSREDCQDIHKFLSEVSDDSGDGSTLREVVFDYLELRKEVVSFVKHGVVSLESEFQSLLGRARSTQRRLQILMQKNTTSPKLFVGLPLVPNSVLCTELMSSLYFLVTTLQESAEGTIADQGNIYGSALVFGKSSQLAFSCSNDDFVFNQIDSKAALRGKYRMNDITNLPISTGPVYRPQRL